MRNFEIGGDYAGILLTGTAHLEMEAGATLRSFQNNRYAPCVDIESDEAVFEMRGGLITDCHGRREAGTSYEYDGAVYVCGTPWRGKEGWGGNYTLPVAGICVIEQSPENHIRKLSVSEASRHIFKQVLISRDSEESFDRFWSLLNRMMTTVDIYLLQCNRDPEASRLSYLTMRRKQNAENQKGISAAPSGR